MFTRFYVLFSFCKLDSADHDGLDFTLQKKLNGESLDIWPGFKVEKKKPLFGGSRRPCCQQHEAYPKEHSDRQ